MSWDPLSVSDSSTEPAVMAAIDDDGSGSRLVIADVSVDESWLSVSVDAAASLEKWC